MVDNLDVTYSNSRGREHSEDARFGEGVTTWTFQFTHANDDQLVFLPDILQLSFVFTYIYG